MYRRNPRADAERISQVLSGAAFPAAKWQLIMLAEEYGADGPTRAELWGLPARTYPDLASVLTALGLSAAALRARAARQMTGRVRPLR